MLVIPKSHLDQIETSFALSNRIYGDYTTDPKHWATKWITDNLLKKADDIAVTAADLQVLNLYSGLWYIIVDKYENGVGEPTMPNEMEKYQGTRQNVSDIVSTGYCYAEIVRESGKILSKAVPANEVVFGDVPTRYVYITKENAEGEETMYLFRKKYFVGYNTNELYLLDKNSKSEGTPASFGDVGLSYLPIEETGLKTYSIFYGKSASMFKIVQSLVFAFERNLVDVQTQFYKYLEAWLLMSGVRFGSEEMNSDGSVKKSVIRDRIVNTSDPNAMIQYITMENPALQQLIDFTSEKMLRQISVLTSIPAFYFSLDETGGAFGETATTIRLQDYIKKCEKYRGVINDIFDEIFKALGNTDGSIFWGAVIEKSPVELLDEYSKANNLGIITKKHMIMEYMGKDEKEAEAYMKELEDQTRAEAKLTAETTPAPVITK